VARNQGISLATAPLVLILDVDTVVTAGAIDTLVAYLEEHPECGLVAARLVDIEGNLQFTCRKYPTVTSKILRRIPFRCVESWLASEEMRDWDHASPREVDYVIGACQLVRRSVIQEIGPIDENIFYGPEDVDYCLRVWKAGYSVVYNPRATIIHDQRRITKGRLFTGIGWEHIKGLAYFFLKHKYCWSRRRVYRQLQRDAQC